MRCVDGPIAECTLFVVGNKQQIMGIMTLQIHKENGKTSTLLTLLMSSFQAVAVQIFHFEWPNIEFWAKRDLYFIFWEKRKLNLAVKNFSLLLSPSSCDDEFLDFNPWLHILLQSDSLASLQSLEEKNVNRFERSVQLASPSFCCSQEMISCHHLIWHWVNVISTSSA